MKHLTPEHIALTLRAICYHHPLPTTPLFRLKCVPNIMYDHLSSEIVMTDWLVNVMTDQMNYHRSIQSLTPIQPDMTKDVVSAHIADAFNVSVRYLQAWTVLYARVARTDLEWSINDISEITNTHPRTLRRRQTLGIHCLYAHIIRLEQNCGGE